MLWLNGTRVTDAGLDRFLPLVNLTHLELAHTPINGSRLSVLKPLARLRFLTLEDTAVDDRAARQLGELMQLTSLGLDHTRITDAGLADLGKLVHLETLWLSGTHITDAGLAQLGSLKQLARCIWKIPASPTPALPLSACCFPKSTSHAERLLVYRRPRVTTIGMILFPGLTQLDLTAPYEVFARLPDTRVSLAGLSDAPVKSEFGLTILPDCRLDRPSQFDVLFVPGGPGVNPLLDDDAFLECLAAVAARAKWVTAVCTGALLLGAAGLFAGLSGHDALAKPGAFAAGWGHAGGRAGRRRPQPHNRRRHYGRHRFRPDAGRRACAAERWPKEIQLVMEYAPAPPYTSGSPATADPELVSQVSDRAPRDLIDQRRASLLRRQQAIRGERGIPQIGLRRSVVSRALAKARGSRIVELESSRTTSLSHRGSAVKGG